MTTSHDGAEPTPPRDRERDSVGGRVVRVARVGAGLSSAAVTYGATRIFGGDDKDAQAAKALRAALGGVKGPLMKVAQMLSTVPDFLPAEYADELAQLQAHAPSMGWSFVKRRMKTELGAGWRSKFATFEQEAAHAASLGQVHRAVSHDGRDLACKLQYPDMASAVEADVAQLNVLLGVFKRFEKSIDPTEMATEVAARLREELDYERERKAMDLYRAVFADVDTVEVPQSIPELSTRRLLTMTWLDGQRIEAFEDAPQDTRNAIAQRLFEAWWSPMYSVGVIHGDPHLGNYAVRGDGEGLNLLDFGCVRMFPPRFVKGVVDLYRALLADDAQAQREAYETWGFTGLNDGLLEALNLWARFIYGPLLDDRVRTVADGVAPSAYGRTEAFEVRKLLKERGPVKIPREFVFMDRAAIGVGAALIRLGAELNFHDMYQRAIDDFDVDALAARQDAALAQAGLIDAKAA